MKKLLLWMVMILMGIFAQSQVSEWSNGGGNPARNALAFVNGPVTDSVLWQDTPAGLFGMPGYIEGNKLVTMRFLSMTNAPIVCYDLITGELQWQKEITGLTGRSLPVGVRDGQVYAVSYKETQHDTLYALNLANGERVWTCEVTVNPYITASVSFTGNGDLVIERTAGISRIDYQTGEMVWNCPLVGFVGGCMEVAVNNSNNTGYCIEQVPGGMPYVAAIDLSAGTKKYNYRLSETHPGGGLQQAPILVGNNGVIYAHKQGDNVTALSDDGTSLSLLWETEIFGNAPFSQLCTGPDGSVYAPSDGRVIRINPENGLIINTSETICNNPELFQLRLSATYNDLIFATNGENRLYVFSHELTQIWSDNIPSVNTSGAAIGSDGLIAVSGSNTIKVYTPENYTGESEYSEPNDLSLFPNPVTDYLNILADGLSTSCRYMILDSKGNTVLSGRLDGPSRKVDVGTLSAGFYLLRLDNSSRPGVRFIKL